MQYIIATTWNGEGYSYQNKAELKQFESDADAQKYILEQFADNENEERYEVKVTKGRVSFDNREDQGSYQWIKAPEDIYGVAIRCNVNEVEVCNEKQYSDLLDNVIAEADPDEVAEIESNEEVFLNAYEGDYDYQFIKF